LRKPGLVVALSGIDSSGKSTQRERLVEALRRSGYAPVTLWTRPGYTPGLEALKHFSRALRGRGRARDERVSGAPGRYPRRAANLGSPLRRRLWLAAALLDLLWWYGVRVRLWKILGRAVVCDRYLLDCLVDFRVNFPDDPVERGLLWRWLARISPRPDAAFCLMIPTALSLERSRGKARFHREGADVLERRRLQYLAASEELRVRVLEGTQGVDAIAGVMELELARALAGAGPGAGRSDPAEAVEEVATAVVASRGAR
jgi:thymidylate kinase